MLFYLLLSGSVFSQACVLINGACLNIGGGVVVVPSGGGGAPSAPTEVIATQGGGPTVCSVNGGSGCSTNTAIFSWPSVSGATYYVVYRNGSTLGSGGCSGNISALTCTDGTATNLNRVNTYGDETTYAYQVEACNGSGCSTGTYGAWWLYHGQAYNSGANYSGGGYGGYAATKPIVNVSSGSNIITVTDVGSYTIQPYNSIADQSSNGGGGQNLIPFSTGNSALGNPYILPFGTSGTSGTGANGTYAISVNATGNYTGDVIFASPGQYSQEGSESLPVTSGDPCGGPELGHTYEMAVPWAPSGQYIQEYVASPGVFPTT